VRRTYVADFRALDIPRDTPIPTLTLVTCYPFDAINPGGPLRYVVVAEAT
jgi:sortase A